MRELLIGGGLLLVLLTGVSMKRVRQNAKLEGGMLQTFTVVGQTREALIFGKKQRLRWCCAFTATADARNGPHDVETY